MRLFTFNKPYFAITSLLFATEVLIALYVTDSFVRPYLGDTLVVILLYCFIRSFSGLPVFGVALSVLIISFTIEFLQYINIVKMLGLENSAIASIVLGTSFAWADVLAYVAGFVIVLISERILNKESLPLLSLTLPRGQANRARS